LPTGHGAFLGKYSAYNRNNDVNPCALKFAEWQLWEYKHAMTGKKGLPIDWPEFWAIRNRSDTGTQIRWDHAVGFEINPETQKVTQTRKFYEFANDLSANDLMELLSGAPLPLVRIYAHRLPWKDMKKIARFFPIKDLGELENAWRNPIKITDPKASQEPKK
jgi:hypothetical protein